MVFSPDGMGSRRVLLVLVLLVSLCGCQSLTLPGSDSGDTPSPQAELHGIEKIETFCFDNTGLGQNTTTVPTDTGEIVFINYTIKADSPDATLNATLDSVASDQSNWLLQITSQSANTDQSACTSRIKYSAKVEVINTDTYSINITHNGRAGGSIGADKDSSGASSVVGVEPSERHPTNNSSP